MDAYFLYFYCPDMNFTLLLTWCSPFPSDAPECASLQISATTARGGRERGRDEKLNYLAENILDGTRYLQVRFHAAFPVLQLQLYDIVPSLDGEFCHCVHFGRVRLGQRVLCKSIQSIEGVLDKKNMSECLWGSWMNLRFFITWDDTKPPR